jgi:hypothetical protein
MNCPKCGREIDITSSVCGNCGNPLTASDQLNTSQSGFQMPMQPGRGSLILTFGILSLTCFGPLLGIPAWILGHQDLKKINAGIIHFSERGKTKGGMICGMISTLLTPVIIIIGLMASVGLSLFTAQSSFANKVAIINDLNKIAAHASQYKIENGGNSYTGYTLSDEMISNDNAEYSALVVSSTTIKLTAVSTKNEDNKITVYINEDGTLYDWTMTGDFEEM